VKGKSAMRGEWPAFPDLNATWLKTYSVPVIRPARSHATQWRVRTHTHCKKKWLINAAGCLNTVHDSSVNYKQIGIFYKCQAIIYFERFGTAEFLCSRVSDYAVSQLSVQFFVGIKTFTKTRLRRDVLYSFEDLLGRFVTLGSLPLMSY
jgi:hypothetical protein